MVVPLGGVKTVVVCTDGVSESVVAVGAIEPVLAVKVDAVRCVAVVSVS